MNLFPKFALVALLGAFCASPIQADYIYEANQGLYDLQTNSSGTTGLGSNDDSVSGAFNLGFTFTFYGEDFTHARMATNGCLHFKTSGAYCNDYTPDPLTGQHTYTLYPFWTDLIKDNGSAMKAKAFNDYTIFGWYKMREYNQSNTDNSFEVWLYPNNTFEYRYRELDIDSHDVLIGEIGSGTSEVYTYLYFDECNTGTTNSSSCVNYNWNSSSNAANTLLEGGGSLYGVGTGNALDCSSALNNAACPGYAAAYLAQQCDLNSLYSNSCTGYAAAYLAQQCALDSLYDSACPYYASTLFDADCEDDPQFSPACAGYTQEASVAYYTEYEEDTYGYEEDSQYGYDEDGNAWAEEDMWYDEEYDEYLDPNDPCFENRCEGFTDADWYALDIEEFGQEQVDLLYGTEVAFDNEGMVDFSESTHSTYDELDTNFDIMDQEMEEYHAYVDDLPMEEYHAYVDDLPELFEIEEFSTVIDYMPNDLLEEFEFQVLVLNDTFREEEEIFEEFENIEEFEEWYEEEMEEYFSEEVFTEEEYEEELYAEEEIFEEEFVEEIFEDIEELREELIEEELLAEEGERAQTEELLAEETPELVAFSEPARQSDRSSRREAARRIVAGTIAAATRSTDYSGSTAGTSATQTGTSVASGGASSTGGISSTSSPSMSDQFSSASQQTQQVLAMSPSTAVASSSIGSPSTAVASSSIGGGGTTFASSSSSSSSSVSSSTTVASNNTSTSSGSSTSDSSSSGSSVGSSSVGSSSVSITPMPGMNGTTTGTMVDVQVSNLSGEIDTAMSGAMTASEADTIADQIVAANIEEQQEQGTTTQEETGKYGDESTLVAYLGYVPGFNAYTSAQLPKQTSWYEPTSLDGGYIGDNIQAFYQLAGTNIRNMTAMVNSQPNLLGE